MVVSLQNFTLQIFTDDRATLHTVLRLGESAFEIIVTQRKFDNMKLNLNKLFTMSLVGLVLGGCALTVTAGTEAKVQITNDDLKATGETPAMTWFVDNRGGRDKPDARRGGRDVGRGKSGSCRNGRGGGHGKPGAQRGGPGGPSRGSQRGGPQRGPGGPSRGAQRGGPQRGPDGPSRGGHRR